MITQKKLQIILVCLALLAGTVGFLGGTDSPWHCFTPEPSENGLPMYGKAGPFIIYSSEDHSSYLVANDTANLQMRVKKDGVTTVSHFLNGFSALETELTEENEVTSQTLYRTTSDGELIIAYTDTDGNGEWDVRIDYRTRKVFDMKDDSWIEREPANP